MDARALELPTMDRHEPASLVLTEADLRGLLAWVERERAITRLLHRGRLGYGEFLLRRQLSYDRLVRETTQAG